METVSSGSSQKRLGTPTRGPTHRVAAAAIHATAASRMSLGLMGLIVDKWHKERKTGQSL